MKKYATVFVFALMAAVAGAQTKPDNPASGPKWQTLSDSAFLIEYPSNWTADQTGNLGVRFILMSPTDSDTDAFRENINLNITDLGAPDVINLDLFAEAAEEQIKQYITAAQVLRSSRISPANGQAAYHEIEFTGNQGGSTLHWKQHYRLKGRYAYILTFTAHHNAYDQHLKLANKIMESFKVL